MGISVKQLNGISWLAPNYSPTAPTEEKVVPMAEEKVLPSVPTTTTASKPSPWFWVLGLGAVAFLYFRLSKASLDGVDEDCGCGG